MDKDKIFFIILLSLCVLDLIACGIAMGFKLAGEEIPTLLAGACIYLLLGAVISFMIIGIKFILED